MAGNARKKFQVLVRIAEVESSIPFESTKTRNRCSFYCGDFSLDRPISSAGGAARKKSFNIKHRVK